MAKSTPPSKPATTNKPASELKKGHEKLGRTIVKPITVTIPTPKKGN